MGKDVASGAGRIRRWPCPSSPRKMREFWQIGSDESRRQGRAAGNRRSSAIVWTSSLFSGPTGFAQFPERGERRHCVRPLLNLTDLPRDGESISANRLTPLSCSLYSTEPRFCRGKKMLLGSRNRTRVPCRSCSLSFFHSLPSLTGGAGRAAGGPRRSRRPTLSSAVDSGVEQERAHHWIDAIETYEKALKQWPDNSDLKYGLRRSEDPFRHRAAL